ncbi:PREDICTED: interleukin-17 receptor B isoform X1 [Gavialis gangeticus]|uniref:interleukin-17 receptor B isoform X1 n=1 Tax=Gavialis gangeticus TaxID=94835 RepID=UPI00092EDDC9|nr:PREDICTED: interleukin-17 receptor B isoform X1 [Gavialis gangeticus]
MTLAACVLLSLVLSSCGAGGYAELSTECGLETGPASELRQSYNLTPADLYNLNAKFIEDEKETQFRSYLINISWGLSMDASIKELTATKICVISQGTVRHFECVRCSYTEKFQSQTTAGNQRWQFHYTGFPVEPVTNYFIHAYNLPPANIYEDSSSKTLFLISPGCNDHVMKYSKSCIEEGSLWDPNITVCKTEAEVEVNFTTSSLGTRYTVFLCDTEDCSEPIEKETNETRTSVKLPVRDRSNNITVQIIPYFPKCQYDCPRRTGTLTTCIQNYSNGANTIDLIGRCMCFILVAIFITLCVIVAVLCFMKNHETIMKQTFFHHANLHKSVKVLVIYPKEVCFHHTVLTFAKFLHDSCQIDVIIDMWQKQKIAEKGPVQWLAAQKETADKIIFLCSSNIGTECDESCYKNIRNHKDNSDCMFALAFNLFCSDLKNRSSLHKYIVVSFNEINSKDTLPTALKICPKYYLMKDIDNFCRHLSIQHSQTNGKSTKKVSGWRSSIRCTPTEEYSMGIKDKSKVTAEEECNSTRLLMGLM